MRGYKHKNLLEHCGLCGKKYHRGICYRCGTTPATFDREMPKINMNLLPKKTPAYNKREKIRKMFGGRCAYCGVVLHRTGLPIFTVDHIIPIVKGGSNEISNLLPSCGKCNGFKGSLLLDEYKKEIIEAYGIDFKFYYEKRNPLFKAEGHLKYKKADLENDTSNKYLEPTFN